jgi:type I restriction enzyme S subunit
MSPVGQAQFALDLYGGTKDGLSLDDIKSLVVLVPPAREQQQIVDYLDEHDTKVTGLVRTIRDAIDRLREFRTALIAAAVTGKIDVREEAA